MDPSWPPQAVEVGNQEQTALVIDSLQLQGIFTDSVS